MKELFIKTVPIPKGRPRFYGGHVVTPEKTRKYEKLIRDSWEHGIVEGEYLVIAMAFTMPIPQSYSNKKKKELEGQPHTKKPDLDNLVKAVLDALNDVAFKDDSKIWRIMATKEYGSEPKVWIGIHEADEEVRNLDNYDTGIYTDNPDDTMRYLRSTQAVSMVRCKECKFWIEERCEKFQRFTDMDFYCADGKRR